MAIYISPAQNIDLIYTNAQENFLKEMLLYNAFSQWFDIQSQKISSDIALDGLIWYWIWSPNTLSDIKILWELIDLGLYCGNLKSAPWKIYDVTSVVLSNMCCLGTRTDARAVLRRFAIRRGSYNCVWTIKISYQAECAQSKKINDIVNFFKYST